MIVPNFTMFAAAYMSNTHHATFSVLIAQEFSSNVSITNNDGKLFRQSSMRREERREKIATSEQFKQNKHNFDVNLEQIDGVDMKWFSFFDAFDFCRNIEAKQTTLTYRYEPVTHLYKTEKNTLQFALNFYNMVNSNNLYMQKVSSFFEVKTDLLVDNQTSQESIENQEREQEQKAKTKSLPLYQEELLEDAFTHKASSAHDAFATEDSSSLKKQTE